MKKITVSFKRSQNYKASRTTYRYFDIAVKNASDWRTSSEIIDKISDKINDLMGYEAVQPIGCPWEIGNEYGDALCVDIDDDYIMEQMKEIQHCYKEAKQIVMKEYR